MKIGITGLSTLPDNPGVSRFWTMFPVLQIGDQNLQYNFKIFQMNVYILSIHSLNQNYFHNYKL